MNDGSTTDPLGQGYEERRTGSRRSSLLRDLGAFLACLLLLGALPLLFQAGRSIITDTFEPRPALGTSWRDSHRSNQSESVPEEGYLIVNFDCGQEVCEDTALRVAITHATVTGMAFSGVAAEFEQEEQKEGASESWVEVPEGAGGYLSVRLSCLTGKEVAWKVSLDRDGTELLTSSGRALCP